MSPYFNLFGRAQSINNTSSFGEILSQAFIEAADMIGNSNLINHSNDGVRFETAWKFSTTISSLKDKYNQLSFPDTKYSIKRGRYKMLGGACAAAIGIYWFDPWILRYLGASKEIIRVEYYASDSVVLRFS